MLELDNLCLKARYETGGQNILVEIYFIMGIFFTMRRYIFQIMTAGKLMVRYRVTRPPKPPATITNARRKGFIRKTS